LGFYGKPVASRPISKLNLSIMKKYLFSCGFIAASVVGFFAFSTSQSVITGNIVPAEGAEAIWAFSGTDSTRGMILNTGNFSLTVKPGIYKLVVDAKSPYKDVLMENVEVKQDRPLDVGQIILQK
jgi:hypothetical protein